MCVAVHSCGRIIKVLTSVDKCGHRLYQTSVDCQEISYLCLSVALLPSNLAPKLRYMLPIPYPVFYWLGGHRAAKREGRGTAPRPSGADDAAALPRPYGEEVARATQPAESTPSSSSSSSLLLLHSPAPTLSPNKVPPVDALRPSGGLATAAIVAGAAADAAAETGLKRSKE